MKQHNHQVITIATILGVLFLLSPGRGFNHIGWTMFLGPVFMILILLLIIWLVASLIQKTN